MLAIFPVILLGLERHWLLILAPSAIVYLIVQIVGVTVPAYPEGHVWYFNPLAWQFLFVAGAVLGNRSQTESVAGPLKWAVPVAAAIFVAAFAVKLSWTIHGLWEEFPGLFIKELWPVNKNNLSPLR